MEGTGGKDRRGGQLGSARRKGLGQDVRLCLLQVCSHARQSQLCSGSWEAVDGYTELNLGKIPA